MSGKYQFWLHLILIFSLIISTALVSPVTASPTTLYVDPPSIIDETKGIGTSFTVDIKVDYVTNLRGFEFKLFYKTAVLTANSVTLGDFFPPVGPPPGSMELIKEINDTIGYVWYAVATGIAQTGPGWLATISFTVDSLGGSCLYLADTKLGGLGGTPISHEVDDGHFVNAPVHDIAITSVTPFSTEVLQGQTVDVTVVARNHGNFTESFNVTLYADLDTAVIGDEITVGTQTNITLVSGTSTTPPLTFTWDTTDLTPGKYTISANATTVPEESDTTDNTYNMAYDFEKKIYDYVTITVIRHPVADFNYSPATPAVNQIVTFNASNSTPNGGKIETYQWDFGDGTTTSPSVPPVATHPYTSPGTFYVILTIEDSEGLTDTTWKPITIYLRDVALVNITASPTEVTKPEPVFINATVANEGGLSETFNVTIYYDGNPIETQTDITLEPGKNTTQTFTWYTTLVTAGNYTISAEVSEVSHETDPTDNFMTDGNVTVATPPGYPVASFTYLAEHPVVGETVTFNASASTDPDGEIISYHWDFGDDTTEIYIKGVNLTDTANHAYSATGTYNVTLTVKDNDGLTDSVKKSITIAKMSSTISIAVSPTSITVGESTTLSGYIDPIRAGVNVTIWYRLSGQTWSILETMATDSNSQYFYDWTPETAGTYEVKASWEGDENTEPAESDVTTLDVKAPPVASFTHTPSAPVVGETVTFNASASTDPDGEIVSWDWDFGDETVSTGEIVTHTYAIAGDFTVNLSVTDNDGLTNTETKEITIGKSSSIITISASPAIITVGESTTISGSITPTRAEVNITTWYKLQGEGTWSIMTTLKTDETSQYSYSWTPQTVATLQVKASWEGDENTEPAESDVTTVTVNKVISTISITFSTNSITLGSSITINGTISPPRAEVTVTIHSKLAGGTWSTLTTITTDLNSHYSYAWTPDAIGIYDVKASWQGDENTQPSESTISTITVNEVSAGIPPYLIAAVGVIIVACCIAAYYLIRKKP